MTARMIAYARVSTEEQAALGFGLPAQEADLRRAAELHGWELIELVRDEGLSAKTLARPGLQRALRAIARGEADGLVVSKLDRLTRSVIDFGELLDWFRAAGAALVALDMNVDTSTPSGKMIASIIVVIAEWERETIAARTKAGLAAKRANGEPTGRPALADHPELAERIRALHADGLSLHGICAALNAEGVPTARGGATWRPSALQKLLGYERPATRRRRAGLPPLPRRRPPR
jgi:DNA invertase Pin-like site-specific DNA recombinase